MRNQTENGRITIESYISLRIKNQVEQVEKGNTSHEKHKIL